MLSCGCGDRAWALLTWLGFTLDERDGTILWQTKRGRAHLFIDLKAHPTRTTLMALVVRACL